MFRQRHINLFTVSCIIILAGIYVYIFSSYFLPFGGRNAGEVDGGTTNNGEDFRSTELDLLAKFVYAEARGEPFHAQVGVAAVVINRVSDPRFPNTIAAVIFQPWAFSGVADGQLTLEPNSQAVFAALDALNGWDPTFGSVYFFNENTEEREWLIKRDVVVELGSFRFTM